MIALTSIKVGDAEAEPPIRDLVDDLAHTIHVEAIEHYGRRSGCYWTAFCEEAVEGHVQSRADFIAALEDLHVPDAERYIREYDAASRPVAVIHWWEVEEVPGVH